MTVRGTLVSFVALAALAAFAMIAPGCTQKAQPPLDPEMVRREMERAHSAAHQAQSTVSAARGRSIYLTACISCHNPNPRLPGALGPEVYGASLPLLTARILNGTYPPNYKPKRPSHTMAPLPHLRAEIPALHIFLNSP